MSALTDLLAAQGRTDELRKRAESGDPAAGMRLVELEGKQKHTEWLRNASEQDWQAYRRRTDQLRERTDPSDHVTWVSVAQMLGEQGRISEAIEILREHVNVLREQAQTEDTQVLGVQLADALAELGCTDDAIEILREGAGAGSLIAAQRLVTLLAKQGPAEDLWREVDAGTIFASEALIELLETGEETKQRGVHIRRFGLNPDGSIASEHTAERTDFLRYRDR